MASGPARLFRADTPHDVLCACMVASGLPRGRDVLAISIDKTEANETEFREAMLSLARLHDWRKIVNISDLPMNPSSTGSDPSPLRRLQALLRSTQRLRQELAPAFDLDPSAKNLPRTFDGSIDELYITCLHHPDVRTLHGMLPSATKVYYPHGFGSLDSVELAHYAPHCTREGAVSFRRRLLNAAKCTLLGRDAVTPHHVDMNAAYSFWHPAPWAKSQHKVPLSRSGIESVFAKLPDEIQRYFVDLARRLDGRAVLLPLTSCHLWDGFPFELELECLTELVRPILATEGLTSLLVKPHPINGADRVKTVAEHLAKTLPRAEIFVVNRFRHYPVELVLSPFKHLVHASLGSSSIRTLSALYGFRTYSSRALVRRLFAYDARIRDKMDILLDDYRNEFIETSPDAAPVPVVETEGRGGSPVPAGGLARS